VFLLGYLVTLRTTFVDVYSPASIFIVSVMAACLALLLTFQGATSIFLFDFHVFRLHHAGLVFYVAPALQAFQSCAFVFIHSTVSCQFCLF
jgi:hypothetical protein